MKVSTVLFTGFLFFFLTVHFLMGAILFCPTAKLATLITGSVQEYFPLESYPLYVRQAFPTEDLIPVLSVNNPSLIEKLFLKSLRFRVERIFTGDKKKELYLNTLNFGGGIIGLNGASHYYFQKPITSITQNESVTLASLYKIFKN